MERTTLLTWSWLHVLTKKRYDLLSATFGSLDAALERMGEQMLRELSCRDDTVLKTLNRLEEFDPQAYESLLRKRGITLLSLEDAAYPAVLRQIPDPPIFLSYRGDLAVLAEPCVALVGARGMSAYGKRVTEAFVPPLVHAGFVTVSGLALGIDTEVARQTIATGGKTVAALGHGLGSIYPRSNSRLAEEIVEGGGLLLSEFPLDTVPDKYTFPARNRVIAAVSQGTVILEAGAESGALITADLALEYGREVFAVPGPVFEPQYAGCHALIAGGRAKLVVCAQDVLEEFGIRAVSDGGQPKYAPQSEAEAALLAVLTAMPQPAEVLLERSGLLAAELNATLTMMELAGAARNTGNGLWVRT